MAATAMLNIKNLAIEIHEKRDLAIPADICAFEAYSVV